MKSKESILAAAQAAPSHKQLEDHLEAILLLREKGYNWEEISAFLKKHEVDADATEIYRLVEQEGKRSNTTISRKVPSADHYQQGLKAIKLTNAQRIMLQHHYESKGRTTTATELANQAKFKNYGGANLWYGKFAKALGLYLDFEFDVYDRDPDRPVYLSSICMEPEDAASPGTELPLVMRPELADALQQLGWFD